MKRIFYAIDYYATETLQNGKERETVQTVYYPRNDEKGRLSKWSPFSAAEHAEEVLKEQHYYNLMYKGYREVRMNVIAE